MSSLTHLYESRYTYCSPGLLVRFQPHGQALIAVVRDCRTPIKPDKGRGGIPIIIVPAAATAAVNMFNAKVWTVSCTAPVEALDVISASRMICLSVPLAFCYCLEDEGRHLPVEGGKLRPEPNAAPVHVQCEGVDCVLHTAPVEALDLISVV